MRKSLLSLFLTVIGVSAFAQSIPNGGFESWTITNYENPMFYKTSNSEKKNGQIVLINTLKTTDAYAGNYAIKLLSTAGTGTAVQFAYFANGNPDTNPEGGIPLGQKPTGIRFHYKSNINPGDTALFLLIFKKNGASVGQYIYKFTQTKTAYTLFNQTLTPSLTVTPDSVIIAAASSNAFLNYASQGNMFQLDSVSLKGIASQPSDLNGSFEQWQSFSDDKVNGWLAGGGCYRSTDFYTGNYAIELQTLPPSFGDNQIRMGSITNGIPSQSTTLGGNPYALQNDTVVFYYKYLPTDPLDSGQFNMTFKKNGSFISGYSKRLGLAATYKLTKVPINLFTAPDTVIFNFNSSQYPVQQSYVGSDLKVDNFYLKSQMQPISNFSMQPSGCVGQPIQLTDVSFNMPNAWGWIMPGGTPGSSTQQNPVVIFNSIGTKTVTMVSNNQFGAGTPVSKTITINAIPGVASTSSVTPCGGSNVILTASGANSYTWSTGATTSTISITPSVTTNYIVTGMTAGCSNTAIGTVVVPSVPKPDICIVTVDSANLYNEVYWDKAAYPMLDSMIIYREVITNTYKRIGAVSKTALSMFTDTTRSVGPANGDPNLSTYRYKIQMRDTCGSYGPMSLWHNTIYFTHTGGTFFWTNNYLIEGPINPVQTYSLLVCVNPSVSTTYSLIGTTTGNQSTLADPFYNIYSSTADWRVEANLGYACDPTVNKPTPGNSANPVLLKASKSRSNIQNNKTSGIKEISIARNVKVYPNPSNNVVNIELNLSPEILKTAELYLSNVLGSVVYTSKSETQIKTIDVSTLAKGVYTLHVTSAAGSATYKVVVN